MLTRVHSSFYSICRPSTHLSAHPSATYSCSRHRRSLFLVIFITVRLWTPLSPSSVLTQFPCVSLMRSFSPRLTQGCDYGWGRETPQNYVGLRNRFLARTGAGIGTTCRPSLFSYYWQSSERLQICSKTSGIEHEKEPDSAWHTLWNSQQAIIDNNFRRRDSIFTISTSPASKLLLASNPKGTECLGFDKHSKATSQHSLINNNCCHKIHRCKFSFLSFLQIPSQKLADMGMNTAERPRSWILGKTKQKNNPPYCVASRVFFETPGAFQLHWTQRSVAKVDMLKVGEEWD